MNGTQHPKRRRVAITTSSIGRCEAGHSLPLKLSSIASAGFDGVEIVITCLKHYAHELANPNAGRNGQMSEDAEELNRAATEAGEKCKELALTVVSLCPLMNYEGRKDRAEQETHLARAKLFLELAHRLGAQSVQIPGTMVPLSEADEDMAIEDLKVIADAAAAYDPPLRIAYEFVGWSTFVNTWPKAKLALGRIGRPNVFVCLDAFHVGSLLLDPKRFGVTDSPQAAYNRYVDSICATLDPSQDTLFQLSTAETFNPSLSASPTDPKLLTWSRNLRGFPAEDGQDEGAYDVIEMSKKVEKAGFKGWWSMETFEKGAWRKEEGVPQEQAQRAWRSWEAVVKALDSA